MLAVTRVLTSATRKGSYAYGTTQGTTDNIFKWTDAGTGCNTTYCHSDGNGGNGNDNEIGGWTRTANSATASRCRACHGYTTASGTAITTGRHNSHINGSTYSFSCAKCHSATTTDGATITDKSRHVNRQKDVSWDSTNSGGTAYVNSTTTCNNIYCHTLMTSAQWTEQACNSCHGVRDGVNVGSGAPGYRNWTTTSTYRTFEDYSGGGGAHYTHVTKRGYACHTCHYDGGGDGNPANHHNVSQTVSRNNVNVGVEPKWWFNNMTSKYDKVTRSCSDVSCHFGASQNWDCTPLH